MKLPSRTPNIIVVIAYVAFFLAWIGCRMLQGVLTLVSCILIWPWMLHEESFPQVKGDAYWYAWRPVLITHFFDEQWPSIRWLTPLVRECHVTACDTGAFRWYTYKPMR